jgi:Protein of unknown function (DUF3551)
MLNHPQQTHEETMGRRRSCQAETMILFSKSSMRLKMTRIALAAISTLVFVSFDLRPTQAAEGPWCAVASIGQGAVREDCTYNSAEECRTRGLAFDRGSCTQNPRWNGANKSATQPKTHKKHQAQ